MSWIQGPRSVIGRCPGLYPWNSTHPPPLVRDPGRSRYPDFGSYVFCSILLPMEISQKCLFSKAKRVKILMIPKISRLRRAEYVIKLQIYKTQSKIPPLVRTRKGQREGIFEWNSTDSSLSPVNKTNVWNLTCINVEQILTLFVGTKGHLHNGNYE